ncbi:hypothetical protein L6164_022340 [Bauhinia variegata]|uniref:Uncharacterized protein n=1 Tax=Bauhinia variegata TaxID=167791 RepID=A0ACB9MGM0_BAUVA|nr:hypothetical protein L6164_022340 [Bauhinia variegata]
MKKSGLLAASLAAASATAVSASSSPSMQISHQDMAQRDHENCSSVRSSAPEKFAPRFDGLRFIETLITAHR